MSATTRDDSQSKFLRQGQSWWRCWCRSQLPWEGCSGISEAVPGYSQEGWDQDLSCWCCWCHLVLLFSRCFWRTVPQLNLFQLLLRKTTICGGLTSLARQVEVGGWPSLRRAGGQQGGGGGAKLPGKQPIPPTSAASTNYAPCLLRCPSATSPGSVPKEGTQGVNLGIEVPGAFRQVFTVVH